MKILCICLSPAIDATVRMNAWPTDGCVIKNAEDTFAPGGKAVNVARWLARRGATVACGGLLGADNAALFEKELAKYGIEDRFVRVPGSTRVNEMFVTPQGSFKVNRAFRGGPVLSWADLALRREGAPETFGARPRAPFGKSVPETFGARPRAPYGKGVPETFGARPRAPFGKGALETFGACPRAPFGKGALETFGACPRAPFGKGALETFGARPRAPVADVVILSGSLPKDWPADTYRTLVAAAKAAGAKVVLDASGKALVEGVKAHPDVIKPNAEECEALVGFVPKTPDEFRRATEVLKRFCDYPIISDGGAGCWFDGSFVAAPKVDVLDTTAAGDTLLAEWCWQTFGHRDLSSSRTIEQSEQSNNCLWAVAAGSAACTMPGGEPPPIELVERLANENGEAVSSPL